MLQEILDLGFEKIELGHGIRLSLMEGIQRFYDAGRCAFPRCTIFVRCRRDHAARAGLLPIYVAPRGGAGAGGKAEPSDH